LENTSQRGAAIEDRSLDDAAELDLATQLRCVCSTSLDRAVAKKYALRIFGGPAVERWMQEAVNDNRLPAPLVRGLYINRIHRSPEQRCEAAVWLRPGAVISLQDRLGRLGCMAKYTDG